MWGRARARTSRYRLYREPSSLRCGYSNLPRNKKLIAGTAPSHSAPPPSPLTLRLCDHQSQPRRREDRCRRQQQDLPVAQRNWRRVITHVCPNVLIILPLKNYINTYFFFRLTLLYEVDAGRCFTQVVIEDKSLRCALPRV